MERLKRIFIAFILAVSFLVQQRTPTALAACANNASTQFRSAATGNWGDTATWQCSDNGTDWEAATVTPTSAHGVITIRSPYTVTVAASVTVDQVRIDAGSQVTVNSSSTFTVTNDTGTDLTLNGTLLNQGTLVRGSQATIEVGAGGHLIHNATSAIENFLNRTTMDAAATMTYRGSSSLTPVVAMAGNTYGHLVFESSAGTWSRTLSGSTPTTIRGAFTLGSGVTINNSSFVGMNVAGNWTNNGIYNAGTGTITFNGTGTSTYGGSTTTLFYNLTVNAGATLDVGTNTLFNAESVTNNGALQQTRTVSGATAFLNVRNSDGGQKYFGVDITGNLGGTTVKVAGNQECANIHSNSDPVLRCYTITPGSAGTATVRFYYRYAELRANQKPTNLKVWKYSGSGTAWNEVTGVTYNRSTCTSGDEGCYVEIQEYDLSSGTFLLMENNPAAVLLAFLTVRPSAHGIIVAWETESELDNLGFHLYRAVVGEDDWTRLNAAFIPSAAPGRATGHAYTWTDTTAGRGRAYAYRLATIGFDGRERTQQTVSLIYPEVQLWLPLVRQDSLP